MKLSDIFNRTTGYFYKIFHFDNCYTQITSRYKFWKWFAARVEKLRELEILWGAYDIKYLHARPICYGGYPRCIQMQMPKCDDSLPGSELFVASLDDASCPTWQCRLLCDLAYFPFSSACKVCLLFACQRRTPNIPVEKKFSLLVNIYEEMFPYNSLLDFESRILFQNFTTQYKTKVQLDWPNLVAIKHLKVS